MVQQLGKLTLLAVRQLDIRLALWASTLTSWFATCGRLAHWLLFGDGGRVVESMQERDAVREHVWEERVEHWAGQRRYTAWKGAGTKRGDVRDGRVSEREQDVEDVRDVPVHDVWQGGSGWQADVKEVPNRVPLFWPRGASGIIRTCVIDVNIPVGSDNAFHIDRCLKVHGKLDQALGSGWTSMLFFRGGPARGSGRVSPQGTRYWTLATSARRFPARDRPCTLARTPRRVSQGTWHPVIGLNVTMGCNGEPFI